MQNWKIVIAVCGVAAILAFLAWLIIKLKELYKLKNQNTLENCFGEPLYSDLFTLREAKQWIKEREDKIKNGNKAIVLKANQDTLKSLGKDLVLESTDTDFLVIAIVNHDTKKIDDSVLIKYNSLDDELESFLAKGNGVLVVGG